LERHRSGRRAGDDLLLHRCRCRRATPADQHADRHAHAYADADADSDSHADTNGDEHSHRYGG
jgi:hypothetical protein